MLLRVKDDGKLEDAARDCNMALMRSVMALMTSSSTHCPLLSCKKMKCTRRNGHTCQQATISSALFLSLHVHKCTLLYQQLQHIFAMISAVSTCGRGRCRWQLKSGQSAYTMNSHIKSVLVHCNTLYYIAVVTPRWSCLERLRALPKAVHGHC